LLNGAEFTAEKIFEEKHEKACQEWDRLTGKSTDHEPPAPEPRDEPPATPRPIDTFVVCYLSPEKSILGYWGGKAGWVSDRAAALAFDTEAKARGQLTRSKKKFPDLDIRYNSIANLEKLKNVSAPY
jgi:hypothetical protein